MDLIEEYRAAERPDYVTWGGGSGSGVGGGIDGMSPTGGLKDGRDPRDGGGSGAGDVL